MLSSMKKKITMTEMSILKIEYVHESNTIPITFEVTDYAIPSGAEAFFYVTKTGEKGKAKLHGEISGQNVTITPEEETFQSPGRYCGTLIINETNGKSFGSFPIFIEVAPNTAMEG